MGEMAKTTLVADDNPTIRKLLCKLSEFEEGTKSVRGRPTAETRIGRKVAREERAPGSGLDSDCRLLLAIS